MWCSLLLYASSCLLTLWTCMGTIQQTIAFAIVPNNNDSRQIMSTSFFIDCFDKKTASEFGHLLHQNKSKNNNVLRSTRKSTSLLSLTVNDTSNNDIDKKETIKIESKSNIARSVAVAALVATSKSSSKKKKQQLNAFTVQKLEANPEFINIENQRDRSFARNLVSTVERRMGQIDSVLSMCADQYPPKKGKYSTLLQACLRVGAAQILFLKTPSFAAVKETVEVLRHDKKKKVPEPMIKFVNAVLRRVGRDGVEMLEKHTTAAENISPWLVEQWREDWGEENTKKICDQMFVEPHIDLSIKSDQNMELNKLCEEFGKDAIILPNGSIRASSEMRGAVSNWPFYDDGTWWVQDVSSTLPAIALIHELTSKNGGEVGVSQMKVVDMCAAPGGKTSQLISAGFEHVTAVEANARRCRRLEENLDRLGFTEEKYTIVVSEGQKWDGFINDEDKSNNTNDIAGLLVDVPCSATGTGSRRPDVLRKSSDLGDLLETQESIANHCADNLLPKGGIMIYATCSLLKEESEEQVLKLIERGKQNINPDKFGNRSTVAVLETVPFLPGDINGFDAAIDSNGWLRVLPGVLDGDLKNCDGFFVAKLKKIYE